MNAERQTAERRTRPGERAVHNGQHEDNQHTQASPGIDLPFFGHVEYTSVGFLAGLGVAGAVGVIEWPVVAAVGIGYALSRKD